jgi:uncharacterized protein YndB with AHSA1/START domain
VAGGTVRGVSEVIVSIDIDASPEEVFDTMLDPHRLHEWVTIHRELLGADKGEPARGMRMHQRLCLRGAPFKVSWELADCDRPHHARWKGKGPARSKAETEYRLEALDGGGRTRFSYRNVFAAPFGPLGAVASRALVGGVPEVEAKRSLQNLKALLER